MSRLAGFVFVCVGYLALSCYAQAPVGEDGILRQLQTATEESDQGDIAAAEADAKAVIASDPNRSAAWYVLGLVLGQAADFQGSEAAFRRAIQLQPDLAKAHFSLALTLIANPQNKLDWPGAIVECREALKYQPNYPEALNLLGTALASTGQMDDAILTLEHAVALSPTLAEAHFGLALALESKEQLDDAAKEYQAAIAAKPAYPEAMSGYGKLLLRVGKTADAERELEASLRLNPDLTDAHYALARLLRSLNRNQEAAVEFSQAKDLMQRKPDAIQSSQLSNKGLELASRGDLAGAVVALRKAIQLKPDYGVPHYNLGLILADSGQFAPAALELAKAVSLMPGQSKPWFDLGRVLQSAKDRQSALAAVAWAAHLAPSDAAVTSELATLRAASTTQPTPGVAQAIQQPKVGAISDTASGHFDFAMELSAQGDFLGEVGELLRSLVLRPEFTEARRALAQAYFHLGENDRAILEYRKILILEPDQSESHLSLGKLLLAQGEPEEAITHLKLALVYHPNSPEASAALKQAEAASKKR